VILVTQLKLGVSDFNPYVSFSVDDAVDIQGIFICPPPPCRSVPKTTLVPGTDKSRIFWNLLPSRVTLVAARQKQIKRPRPQSGPFYCPKYLFFMKVMVGTASLSIEAYRNQ